MFSIPLELLDQFERGNVLLFIGERIVRDASGQVVIDRLTAQLAARGGVVGEGTFSFPEAAQAYEDERGRQALIQYLRDELEMLGQAPGDAHRLIAGLTDCTVLVTTCLDRRLERAFEEAGRALNAIVGEMDVAFEDEHKAQLYKLRGTIDRPESLVLTEDDYETFFRKHANLSIVLQGYLARKTILFVGYDLSDPLFKRLYAEVTASLDRYARRAYAFGETPPAAACRWCERHGIEVVPANAAAFLQALSEQLAARARPAPVMSSRPVKETPVPLPERPYKLLDYYEAGDADIFCGRQKEMETLTSLIHAHRLVLLYGASGTGKTSLLLAGAVPRLEHADPPYETLYVRALEDPALAIRRALHRRLPDAGLPEGGELVDFLHAAIRALGCPLVLLLDQFEEFFIRLSTEFRRAFIRELGTLYDARDVPVKVVISLREDWLAAVNEIRERIPEVFYIDMRLLPLTREQARQAVTAPVGRLGVGYEPALVERLLDDLAGGEGETVMPPQLQLVCSALYGGLEAGQRTIALGAYEHLGGARGVLRRYLDDELGRLGGGEGALARDALVELVTSQRTKAVKGAGELAQSLGTDLAGLEPVLEKLIRARLLRPVERVEGEERAYELAHEYLIDKIVLNPETQLRKQAEELVRQEAENWRRFGTLMAADKLALIGQARKQLRLNLRELEFLTHSALHVGREEAQYWLARVSNPQQRIRALIEATHSRLAQVREWAVDALNEEVTSELGTITPKVAEALYGLLKDEDRDVQARAADALLLIWDNDSKVVPQAARSLLGLWDCALPSSVRTRFPYKSMLSYESTDESIFFGRQQETQTLTLLIHSHRLVLLYGASGTGKTSLLLAGVAPRLGRADPPYETVYVRALKDPALAIRRALHRLLPDASLPEAGELVDFLHVATGALCRPLVLFFDQFEEFFIRLSPEFRAAFVADLGALYDARDVPVKVVISLREDCWLAAVNEIEARIPDVFDTRMRLLPLTRNQARQAIAAPVEQLGVSYELALLERLLDDLAGSEGETVMPPQLQLVCSALYGGLEAGQRTIALGVYERLGGALGVLRRYLDDELARLGREEGALARDALVELVTSQRTKAVKGAGELALALGTEPAGLEPVLEKLVRARLLRPVERVDGAERAYELAHEYLIAEIVLGPEAVARKEAEELLRQGIENWARFKTLPSAETFELIDAQRERLRLDGEAEELMLRGALRHGRSVGHWLGHAEDGERALALAEEALLNAEAEAARRSLGTGAEEVGPERLRALTGRLHGAWRKARGTGRTAASDVLWALRWHLPRGQRWSLALARSPRAMRRTVLPLAGGMAAVLIVLLALWARPLWMPKPRFDGDDWVPIPAGEFTMGSDPSVDPYAGSDGQPQHMVYLDAYRIGRYEVTNEQYDYCVQATICDKPSGRIDEPSVEKHPVVYVDWFNANKFCEWIGSRLPTEAEWEKAARGTDWRIYPWGNGPPDCDRANFGDCVGGTTIVGAYPSGASPYGAMDMAGNVWEWVADRYDSEYYASSPEQNPKGPDSGTYRVVRGGSWNDDTGYARAAYRYYYVPDNTYGDVGFRCVSPISTGSES